MALGSSPVKFAAAAAFIGTTLVVLLAGRAHQGHQKKATIVRSESPDPADILLAQLRRAQDGPPEELLRLHRSVGQLYRDLGRYPEALEHLEKARDLARSAGGGEALAAARVALGELHWQRGLLKDARRELEAAYVTADPAGAQAVAALRHLANTRRDMGQVAKALELYAQAKPLCEAHGGTEVAMLLRELGEAQLRKGDTDEAMANLQAALARFRSAPGHHASDPELAITHQLIGRVHHLKGDVHAAVAFYRKALASQERYLRAGHPNTVTTQINIARSQRDLGDLAAAVRTVLSAEDVLAAGQGPELFRLLVVKADLLREQERFEDAELAVQKALKLQVENFGDESGNPELAAARNGYGSLFHDQHRLQEAARQYMLALDINLATVGEVDQETAATYNNLGNLYQDIGDDQSAQTHFQKCLDILLQTVGAENPDVSAAYNNIGTVLFRQGKVSEAVDLFRKAVVIVDAAGVPAESPDRAVYQQNLEDALKAQPQQSNGAEVPTKDAKGSDAKAPAAAVP